MGVDQRERPRGWVGVADRESDHRDRGPCRRSVWVGRGLAVAFEVNPVHLGVIFLANLELGFLCPPMGLNLFLSATRFQKPLPYLYRQALPFLAIMTVGVLFITYVESASLWLLRVLGKA